MVAPGEVRVRSLKGDDDGDDTLMQARSFEAEEEMFLEGVGYIKPPYDPLKLCDLFEDSSALSQNVDAYETNIDGFGYVLEPVVNFDQAEGREAVRRDLAREGEKGISDEELDRAITRMVGEAEAERVGLKNFLDYISISISFVTLRKRTRKDLEVTGNAYWEILRNEDGEISKVLYVPSYMVRLMALHSKVVEVKERQRVGLFGWEDLAIARRFRTYVQKLEGTGKAAYFKEFGDPRTVCAATGVAYNSVEEMRLPENKGEDAVVASEMIHFKIHSPSSPYGVPRWIGALASVLGSISMEAVNLAYFDNKGVPPLAILVSNGILTEATIKRLEDVLEKEIKGKKNFHKVLVLEATNEPGDNTAPRIEMKPLMSAILSDAIYQKYDERNIDKIGSKFRVPRLLRGDVRDFNKSTSWASIRFAEEQVFSGERQEFDFTFNRSILTDMGIVYWRLVSQGPTIRDPEIIIELLSILAKASALTPNEVRAMAAKALNVQLARIDEDWANRPPSFTLAGRGYLPGEEAAPVSAEKAGELMGRLEIIQKEVGRLVGKVEAGIEDEEVARFKEFVARYTDDEDMLEDVPTQSQRADADAGRGDDPASGEAIE